MRLRMLLMMIGIVVPLCGRAGGEVGFRALPYNIEGGPQGLLVNDWALLSDRADKRNHYVLLGTFYDTTREAFAVTAIVMDFSVERGHVLRTVFEEPLALQDKRAGWASADLHRAASVPLDRNGPSMLIFSGVGSDSHRAFCAEGNAYKEVELPFPRYSNAATAWLDYDRDGWVDLALAGTVFPENEPPHEKPVQLFHNEQGTLVPTDVVLDNYTAVDSLHAIDVNDDEWLDLVVFPATTHNLLHLPTRILVNDVGKFREAVLPLEGHDELVGLSRAHVAAGDIDGDGRTDLLMTGLWNDRLGPRACSTILYLAARDSGEANIRFHYGPQMLTPSNLPNLQGRYTLSDLDADGDTDAFGHGGTHDAFSEMVILENEDGVLTSIGDKVAPQTLDRLVPTYGFVVLPLDIDHDKRLDFILFPSQSERSPMLLMNKSSED